MQALQQVMKVATKVAGSTSGMNTCRMPTLSALVYQLRSSALRMPPAASVSATSPVMAPANEAPKHQVARLMLITRPRRCAGQVSATSIDPSDHSPLVAKVRSERDATKTAKLGDNATTGIISENIAMLTASSERRPTRSESHGQK